MSIFSDDQLLRFAPSEKISKAQNTRDIEFRIGGNVDLSCDGLQDRVGWRKGEIIAIDNAVFHSTLIFSYYFFVIFLSIINDYYTAN